MNSKFSLRTVSLIGLVAALFLSSSCSKSEPVHGMMKLAFSPTSVCDAQNQSIDFHSSQGEETVIEGAAISLGTDPDGNFKVASVRIGSQEIPASNGILNDIHVPPDTNYSFVVSYSPRQENGTHTAILDVVYSAPRTGVIQVSLEGTSGGRSQNCPLTPKLSVLPVALPSQLPFTIKRIALVSGFLPLPITTDPENTAMPFEPVNGLLFLDQETHTAMLPPIPEEARFLLPPTKTAPLSEVITDYTVMSAPAQTRGTYGDDGSLTLQNMTIHLKEAFEADISVTLTTGEVDPRFLPIGLLRTAGFTVTDEGKIAGSPINPQTLEANLVGVSTFTNPKGEGMVAEMIGGSEAALLVTVKINLF